MSSISNPALKSAQKTKHAHFDAFAGPLPVVVESSVPIPPAEPATPDPRAKRRSVWGVYAALSVVSVITVFRTIVPSFARPLQTAVPGATPAWTVEVTTTGTKPATALVYSKSSGFHLVQVPAGQGGASAARVMPPLMAEGDVHIFSLGFTSLHVAGAGTIESGPASITAVAPIVTTHHTSKDVGISIGW